MDERSWNKLAEGYHEEVVSPFYGDVQNPLLKELAKIENKKQKTVAEFGCGLFYLGETLAKDFKQVHASDFAAEMVKKAKKRINLPNVTIQKENILNLKHSEKFDVVISVNALLMPSFQEINKSFQNIFNSVKADGYCFMILPSMESVLYHNMLILHKSLEQNKEPNAITSSKIKAENKEYDFFLGYYGKGKDRQKFYYQHEIEHYLKKVGFSVIEIQKVRYPWGKDVSDYEDFPEEENLWDWFVKARK